MAAAGREVAGDHAGVAPGSVQVPRGVPAVPPAGGHAPHRHAAPPQPHAGAPLPSTLCPPSAPSDPLLTPL
eukprot:1425099-Pyramimonas_sp.AAC.1